MDDLERVVPKGVVVQIYGVKENETYLQSDCCYQSVKSHV